MPKNRIIFLALVFTTLTSHAFADDKCGRAIYVSHLGEASTNKTISGKEELDVNSNLKVIIDSHTESKIDKDSLTQFRDAAFKSKVDGVSVDCSKELAKLE